MISHMAISKSICGNLNNRLKKRGILISLRREDGVVEPKFEGPPVGRGSVMCGFIVVCAGVLMLRGGGAGSFEAAESAYTCLRLDVPSALGSPRGSREFVRGKRANGGRGGSECLRVWFGT
jgi:hypothetical protein